MDFLLPGVLLLMIITGSFGLLNLSTPAYIIPYLSQQIEVFGSPANSCNSSNPVWYYSPAGVLLSHTADIVLSNQSATHFVNVEIRLWDSEYVQHIQSFISQQALNPMSRVHPIPFKWIRMEYHLDSDYDKPVKSQWRSLRNFPKTVSLRIRCASVDVCDRIKRHSQNDGAPDTANVLLAFAFEIPPTRVAPVCFDGRQIRNTPTFSLITEHLTGTETVYVQHADYYAVVHELISASIEGVTEPSEFVDDDQVHRLARSFLPRFRHNVTSTGVFTEEMWKVTYWIDENVRPDHKARHLQELFSNGMKWLQKTMRGDNVTGELGAFGHSQSVMQAFAELRSGVSGVQWDGEKIIVRPMLLNCVNLSQIDERKICNVTVRISNRHSDYFVNAVSLQAVRGRYLQVSTATPVPVTLLTSSPQTSSTTVASPPTTVSHILSLMPSLGLGASECGGLIKVTSSSSGFLRSPTGSSSSDYPNDASCMWLVTGPAGRQLKFTEESSYPFAIAEECGRDKLVIGTAEYCKDIPLSTVTVPSSITLVRFRSDGSVVGRGFSIKVEAV